MRHIDPESISVGEVHRYLLSCVAPRPIAFVGTKDAEGNENLSPFSFFNAFGANPPTIAFSPAFRGTDGSAKHTYENILATREFTVSVVSFEMIEQMNLASADWPRDVDEFDVAGFTKAESSKIAPSGVAESPMFMECRLISHIPLGEGPASGNLMIGEVVMFHIRDSVFEGKYPAVDRLDLVARMGGPFYCRASGDAVFSLAKPIGTGIGYHRLPDSIRTSQVLTANDIGQLATHPAVPSREEVDTFLQELRPGAAELTVDDADAEMRGSNTDDIVSAWVSLHDERPDAPETVEFGFRVARRLLAERRVSDAWAVLGAQDESMLAR